jgi:hypothetical protein
MANPRKKNQADADEDKFEVHTSPEADAIMRAAADGKTGKDWQSINEAGLRIHQPEGSRHRVQIDTSHGETLAVIEAASLANDADSIMVLLYISHQLLPTTPVPSNLTPRAEINLDDVISAIGWEPRSTQERAEMRRRVWRFIKFTSRARIIGDRSYKLKDKMTGKEVETYADAPAWMLGQRNRELPPVQASLFDDDEAPISVEIVATKMWTNVTSSPALAQFLPCGEVLGAIPGAKPSGAWARVIGVALTNFWRRHPQEAKSGGIQPTRRELLERYTPATGAVADLLNGPNPRYAIQYWVGALKILVECEFLEKAGEACLSYEELRDALPRQDWGSAWLNGAVDLKPGPGLLRSLDDRTKVLAEKTATKTTAP